MQTESTKILSLSNAHNNLLKIGNQIKTTYNLRLWPQAKHKHIKTVLIENFRRRRIKDTKMIQLI